MLTFRSLYVDLANDLGLISGTYLAAIGLVVSAVVCVINLLALLESETAAAGTIANKTNGGLIATDLAFAPISKYQQNISNVTVFQS